jgi:hypothetical protein
MLVIYGELLAPGATSKLEDHTSRVPTTAPSVYSQLHPQPEDEPYSGDKRNHLLWQEASKCFMKMFLVRQDRDCSEKLSALR